MAPRPSTGGPVGDHAMRFARGGHVERLRRVAHDLLACRRDAGSIGKSEVALVGELLGRKNGDLARGLAPVILEGVLLQLFMPPKNYNPDRHAQAHSAPHRRNRTFEVMDVLSRAHARAPSRRDGAWMHMEIGEPDFTAPAPVVEAGVQALRDGLTAYTATLGLPKLREVIAGHYASKFSIQVEPARIAVTSGASSGLLTLAALYRRRGRRDPGSRPGYPGYGHFVRAFEGVARTLPVSAAGNFQPTLEMVRAAWGRPRYRACSWARHRIRQGL